MRLMKSLTLFLGLALLASAGRERYNYGSASRRLSVGGTGNASGIPRGNSENARGSSS